MGKYKGGLVWQMRRRQTRAHRARMARLDAEIWRLQKLVALKRKLKSL